MPLDRHERRDLNWSLVLVAGVAVWLCVILSGVYQEEPPQPAVPAAPLIPVWENPFDPNLCLGPTPDPSCEETP